MDAETKKVLDDPEVLKIIESVYDDPSGEAGDYQDAVTINIISAPIIFFFLTSCTLTFCTLSKFIIRMISVFILRFKIVDIIAV